MTYEEIFQLGNSVALISWLVLAIVPYMQWRIFTGVVIASLAVIEMNYSRVYKTTLFTVMILSSCTKQSS